MNISRITFFAILLFILQVVAGTLAVLAVAETGELMIVDYIGKALVSVCLFAYMTWANPAKPYLSAIIVGVSAELIGAISTTLIVGDTSWWHPALLLLDLPVVSIAVILGASIGIKLR